VNLTEMTLQDSNGKVKIQGHLTEALNLERCLRQGDAPSTILFNIVMENVIENTETNPTRTIFDRMRQYTAYAGDVLILGRW
jgi:hypothetical protein